MAAEKPRSTAPKLPVATSAPSARATDNAGGTPRRRPRPRDDQPANSFVEPRFCAAAPSVSPQPRSVLPQSPMKGQSEPIVVVLSAAPIPVPVTCAAPSPHPAAHYPVPARQPRTTSAYSSPHRVAFPQWACVARKGSNGSHERRLCVADERTGHCFPVLDAPAEMAPHSLARNGVFRRISPTLSMAPDTVRRTGTKSTHVIGTVV